MQLRSRFLQRQPRSNRARWCFVRSKSHSVDPERPYATIQRLAARTTYELTLSLGIPLAQQRMTTKGQSYTHVTIKVISNRNGAKQLVLKNQALEAAESHDGGGITMKDEGCDGVSTGLDMVV